jgi:hypothetical protein
MLGGTCTLIGTSTNVAASGYLREPVCAVLHVRVPAGRGHGLRGGHPLHGAGGHRLLPERSEAYEPEYSIREYLSEVVVTPGSPLAGQAMRDTHLAQMGLQVRAVQRGDRRLYPEPYVQLQEGTC